MGASVSRQCCAMSGTLGANSDNVAPYISECIHANVRRAFGRNGAGGSRPGKGRKPWYLLTSENIATADDAWRVVLSYARRWQVEMCYRGLQERPCHGKSQTLVLGKQAKTPADGQLGLRLPALPVGAAPCPLDTGTPQKLVPQNRREVPPSCVTSLQTQVSPLHPLAISSTHPKFGMTHVLGKSREDGSTNVSWRRIIVII